MVRGSSTSPKSLAYRLKPRQSRTAGVQDLARWSIAWLEKHEPEALARASHALMCKDYVRFRLTGALATEISDLSSGGLVASMMGEFASSMGAGSGLATVRGASANMAMLASGVLAGIADALRAHTEAKEGK